jgi:dihydroorotate dehydrogenase (NAD+) catalytic subunit
MVELETRIGNLRMHTPLMAVSGIFGIEYNELSPKLSGVGAVVTKSVTLRPRSGNPEPRIVETPAGMLNSIGLQNPGIEKFLSKQIPELRVLEVPIIASVAGANIEEYVECSRLLAPRDEVDAIELNVSCPNVEKGGMEFGCDAEALSHLVSEVKKVVEGKTLIVKLTPNVTDIALPAQAAVDSGADAISLINTLRGMAIDLDTWKPKLGNRIGGLSGQAIHPVAVYMVYRCYTAYCHRRGVPIIGIGGVSRGEDALELILAGATCVGIGTAMFRDQYYARSKKSVFQRAEEYLHEYMEREHIKQKGVNSISDLVGKAAET